LQKKRKGGGGITRPSLPTKEQGRIVVRKQGKGQKEGEHKGLKEKGGQQPGKGGQKGTEDPFFLSKMVEKNARGKTHQENAKT